MTVVTEADDYVEQSLDNVASVFDSIEDERLIENEMLYKDFVPNEIVKLNQMHIVLNTSYKRHFVLI